jgi:hypothetical protein
MDDPTQAPGDDSALPPAEPLLAGGGESAPAVAPGIAQAPGDAPPMEADEIQRGLLAWLAIMSAGGIACLLLGHPEGAVFFAGAGAFALAQATDSAAALERYRAFVRDRLPRRALHGALFRAMVHALVPVAGAAFYVMFAAYAWGGDPEHPYRFAAAWCAAAAVASLALVSRRLADAATRALFRGRVGRTRRLTARIVVMALLLPVPASILSPALLATLRESGTQLADPGGLVAQLLGELAIAFAGVGWLVRRHGRDTLERLGLTTMRPVHWLVVVVGVGALIGLNVGAEWVERRFFFPLWQQDRDVTLLIAGALSVPTALLLGLCAGLGEEITMRGALQPRLGIVLCAVLFASAHVQYTWFGMGTIALLGIALGVMRAGTNTTTVIVVHALYDVFAALTANT